MLCIFCLALRINARHVFLHKKSDNKKRGMDKWRFQNVQNVKSF